MSSCISRCTSGILASFVLSAAAGSAHADDSAPASGDEWAQDVLDERETGARVWQYGWGAAGYSLALGFGVLAATGGEDARLFFGPAAGGMVIDTTIHMLSSIEPNAAARARENPGQARERLRLAAEAEEHRRSLVFGHLLPAGGATVASLVFWLGLDNLKGAVFNLAAAVVLNEVRLFTQPTSALDAWKAHEQGLHPAALVPRRAASGASWSVAFTGRGVAVVGAF